MLSCHVKITTWHNYFSHPISVIVELTEYWDSGFHLSNHMPLPQNMRLCRKKVVSLDMGLVPDWNKQFCRRYNHFKKVTLWSSCQTVGSVTPPHIHTSKQTPTLLVAWRQKMLCNQVLFWKKQFGFQSVGGGSQIPNFFSLLSWD